MTAVGALERRLATLSARRGRSGIDPEFTRFARDPVAFARERLGFEPDPWQENVLRSDRRRILLNCSRQSGKSTTTAILGLHTALFTPDGLVLMVAPSLRQARLVFDKFTGFLRTLTPRPGLMEDNRLSVVFANGARAVALPGSADTVRGFSSVTMLIEDEAAFVPDDLYRTIRPMLAVSGGRLVLMSTPNGRRGHFYEAWSRGGDEWDRISVTADACLRIDPAFLAAERRALGDTWFRQEYQCEFTETADQVFRAEDIARAFSDDVQPLTIPSPDVKPLF